MCRQRHTCPGSPCLFRRDLCLPLRAGDAEQERPQTRRFGLTSGCSQDVSRSSGRTLEAIFPKSSLIGISGFGAVGCHSFGVFAVSWVDVGRAGFVKTNLRDRSDLRRHGPEGGGTKQAPGMAICKVLTQLKPFFFDGNGSCHLFRRPVSLKSLILYSQVG